MVSVSPRMRDSLDYEEPDTTDPRMEWGFRSLTLSSSGSRYEEHDPTDDHRPFSASPEPSHSRRKRRQRQSSTNFDHIQPHTYQTIADGDLFRLAVLKPGAGVQPIEIELIWESCKAPKREYKCLSYCWQTTVQDAAILVDGKRFDVTSNLLSALRSIRKRREKVLIWIDQICINQLDFVERGHQVSIMRFIYSRARQVVVWLGEFDRSDKLCEYAKKMKRNDSESTRSTLNRILPTRQLQDAVQKLLERPWFTRVWVISEVCLASTIRVSCGGGDAVMSWENLISLVRDRAIQHSTGFSKQAALLGNPKQRIAIMTEMMSQQKDNQPHTDISQLLILAKSSAATNDRDKIYAFYGLTLLTTTPDYARAVESLYLEIAQDYINGIEACYAGWKDQPESTRTWQLMSILYSAGALHQHYDLPSWVPDWTYAWHLAPFWANTAANLTNAPSSRSAWTETLRCEHRAGGEHRDNFEIIPTDSGPWLRLSAIILDTIASTDDSTPAPTPPHPSRQNTNDSQRCQHSQKPHTPQQPQLTDALPPTSTSRYGRTFFRTQRDGHIGLATPGVEPGDVLAVLLGGDVPVVLRPLEPRNSPYKPFRLLCEAFVQSRAVMGGEVVRGGWAGVEDVVLV